jgi:hypothetical protein
MQVEKQTVATWSTQFTLDWMHWRICIENISNNHEGKHPKSQFGMMKSARNVGAIEVIWFSNSLITKGLQLCGTPHHLSILKLFPK